MSRLSLPTALARALEISRNKGCVPVDVVQEPGEDGYRVLWPDVPYGKNEGDVRYVAEVKAVMS